MGEPKLYESALFAILAVLASLCLMLSAAFKRRVVVFPLSLGGTLLLGLLYFWLDSYYAGFAHIILFGAAAAVLLLLGKVEGSYWRGDGGRSWGAAAAVIASVAAMLLFAFAILTYRWDGACEDRSGGFAAVALLGDTLAAFWIMPVGAAALCIIAGLACSFLMLWNRRDK